MGGDVKVRDADREGGRDEPTMEVAEEEPEGSAPLSNCDQIAVEVRSEPVRRKVRKRTASKRRLVAICISCRTLKVLTYGGAFGRKTESG